LQGHLDSPLTKNRGMANASPDDSCFMVRVWTSLGVTV